MFHHFRLSPASWVCCMNCLRIGVLDRIRYCNAVVDAHTSFLDMQVLSKLWMYGEICLHLSSFSVRTQSLISLRIAPLEVRLAIRVLEKILDSAKLKASVVVSLLGVEGVAGTAGAVDGHASSPNLTIDGVECFTYIRVSSSEFDIMSTL